jgi:hypothetical protein
MRFALKIATTSKAQLLRAAIEEMKQLFWKPLAKVQEQKKRGVEFPVHKIVMAAIERHLGMVYTNQMDGCLPFHNSTAKNPQARWWRKETSAPPPTLVALAPGKPPSPGTPPVPPGDPDGNASYELKGMPSRCVYIHSLHPST